MLRLAGLLVAALLIVSCGRSAPAGQLPPTHAPTGAALTKPSAALTSTAPPATAMLPEGAPASETGEPAIASAPPATFAQLRYLLPADLSGYTIPNPDATLAGPTAFQLGLIAPGQEPSPRATIVLAGGESALPMWHIHQDSASGATQVTVRGGRGSLRDDGIAYHLLWEEDGNVYAVLWPTGTVDELLVFANRLVPYDRASWRALTGLPPATSGAPQPTHPSITPPANGALRAATPTTAAIPAGALRYLTPSGWESYRVSPGEHTYANARGFSIQLTPLAQEPGPFTTIRITGGAAAEATWAENQPIDAGGASIEHIPIRGTVGTIASGGLGATIAWVEDGHPYAVFHPGADDTEVTVVAFVEGLWAHNLAGWRSTVAGMATDTGP